MRDIPLTVTKFNVFNKKCNGIPLIFILNIINGSRRVCNKESSVLLKLVFMNLK